MNIPPPVTLDASAPGLAEHIGALSTGAGVLSLEVAGRVTHLTAVPNLQRRARRTIEKLGRFLLEADQDRSGSARVLLHSWRTHSQLETALLLYDLAKYHFPSDYLHRVHLRMPWFVGLWTRDAFPRLVSANRLPQGCDPVVGPFARRDLALLYEQEVQSAFLLRRCTEVLQPDPQHPGCIYGEMKQCLRPCQCAVSLPRYLAEAAAVSALLRENAAKTLRDLAQARDQSMAALDFEAASRIHKQLERLQSAKAARDPVVTDVHQFNGLAVCLAGPRYAGGVEECSESVQIFPMLHGRWLHPLHLPVHQAEAKMGEQALRGPLETALKNEDDDSRNTLEDLALFARWYYSSWREGVWIPFVRADGLPVRKLARAIQKLLRAAEPKLQEPTLR